ncbi:sodium/glutamate symport protein [alpha proteobacterium U9-1i]|nr:sodium/glutamate symport protein [alpha proteobacterium U9-1i]
MKTSLSLIVLASLALGLVAGALIRADGAAEWRQAAEIVEALGGLWLNALRMTVVPLVFSLLVVGIASVQDAAATGKLAARAVLLFTVLLLFAGAFGIYATEGVLALWPIPREAADAFISGAGGASAQIAEPPTLIAWIQGLAPANPVAAAAESAILPLVVFAVFFGFAATRLEATLRDQIVNLFRAVSEAMVIIVRWVLLAGPFGVFALALGVGLRAGFGAAGTLVQYAAIVSIVTLAVTIVAWFIAITWGRQPIGKFTTAAAPVWAIAISTQSSLASLPAMIQAARNLGIPDRVIDLILPLAVAVFRFTSPVANLAVCMVVAHLYGIEPSFLQILGAIVVAYGVSIGSVGLPGQISFIASVAPISIALGVPTELLGILIAIEVIPDIFRTLGNVTGDLAATSILNAGEKEREANA